MASSFLFPRVLTQEGQLASLHLSHNHTLPVILSTVASSAEEEGYAEGVVTNTRFGSFPHTTLIDIPWGSQVRASKVDTGTRGRIPGSVSRKRKADAISTDSPVTEADSPGSQLKEAILASSGYAHLLPPTPENWTTSLPHRTQVVYTPDYSYILHRIRARPGTRLIEAGSGSGSFTHAAVRAVFDGPLSISSRTEDDTDASFDSRNGLGRVFTFEFHPERHEKIKIEMKQHGLDHIVTATHRDVYKDGFLLENKDGTLDTPSANAIFLDLPAPWEALRHLTREATEERPSALDPLRTTHICTFSPCIEQAQRTISAMRKQGWIDIEMVEMQHKRIEIRREYTGLQYDGMRSVNAYPRDVDEAISKLRDIERRAKLVNTTSNDDEPIPPLIRVNRASDNAQIDAARVHYNEGRLIHRTEPDLKTHTSYLVFALLAREWTAEDEQAAKASLKENIMAVPDAPKSHRQLKREAKTRKNSQMAH